MGGGAGLDGGEGWLGLLGFPWWMTEEEEEEWRTS